MEEKPVIDPSGISESENSRDHQLRGYALYTTGDYDGARVDFESAVSLDPNDVEALYGLGLTRKMQGDLDGSADSFNQVLELLRAGAVKDTTRAKMLERLTKGHLNIMNVGDWNLEKEIWKRN